MKVILKDCRSTVSLMSKFKNSDDSELVLLNVSKFNFGRYNYSLAFVVQQKYSTKKYYNAYFTMSDLRLLCNKNLRSEYPCFAKIIMKSVRGKFAKDTEISLDTPIALMCQTHNCKNGDTETFFVTKVIFESNWKYWTW